MQCAMIDDMNHHYVDWLMDWILRSTFLLRTVKALFSNISDSQAYKHFFLC